MIIVKTHVDFLMLGLQGLDQSLSVKDAGSLDTLPSLWFRLSGEGSETSDWSEQLGSSDK